MADLFNYNFELGWDEFWKHGVANYKEETTFYDLLTRVSTGEEASTSVEGSQNTEAIVIDSDD